MKGMKGQRKHASLILGSKGRVKREARKLELSLFGMSRKQDAAEVTDGSAKKGNGRNEGPKTTCQRSMQ